MPSRSVARQSMWRTESPTRYSDELLEVGAFAALLVGLDADFLQAAIARQPGVARHLREVGVDAPHLVGAEPLEQLAQPQRERTRTSAGANVTSPRRVGVTV